MSDVNQIVSVTITRQDARITREGFGTPLVVGVHSEFSERVRTYLDKAAVAVDFAATTEEFIIASMLFSQELSPTKILIGRRLGTVAQANDVTIAGTVLDGDVFTVQVNRVNYSHTAVGGAETPTTIAAALASAIDLGPLIAAVSTLGVVTVSADSLLTTYVMGASSTTSVGATITDAVDPVTSTETLAATLDAIDLENPDYYGLLLAKRGVTADQLEDIVEMGVESESRKKLYAYSTDQASAITSVTTDVFSTRKALSYDRSIGMWSLTHLEYPEAGWFGLQLPKDAGTTNWKFKTIAGATPSILDGTAYTNLLFKNANFIESIKGKNIISSEGVVASGEYIDIIRGIDSTVAEIQEDTYGIFTSIDKIPFTQPGMIAIAGPTQKVLVRKARLGLYVESTIVINIPDVASIPAIEKANRQFKGTTFSVQFQGAINFIELKGVVFP